MKKRLFQYAVLLHPEQVEGKDQGETVLLVDMRTILAKDDKTVALSAARAIPEEHVGSLDRIEIVVRPF